MHILFMAGRELQYPRNAALLVAFESFASVDVVGNRQTGSLIKRTLQVFLKALPKLLFGQYNFVFVGFYGHFLMLPLRFIPKRPILFDVFVSTYDTLCFDRQVVAPQSLLGRLSFWLDRTTCKQAKHILIDTHLHADYFVETFDVPQQKFSALPVGCDEALFYPQPPSEQTTTETLVLYYCNYLPLHGVDIVVQAAKLLETAPIRLQIIGRGQCYDQVQTLAQSLKLKNVEFIDPVPLTALPAYIAQADICLGGHFGNTDKAQRVIAGKIYQLLAMEKALIATDTPANQALLTHKQTAYLCQSHNASALAQAILALHHSPALRKSLGQQGRLLYEESCSQAAIQRDLRRLVQTHFLG